MTDGRRLVCKHCEYDWTYTGNAPYYASCPRCHYKVPVTRTVEFLQAQEGRKQKGADQ